MTEIQTAGVDYERVAASHIVSLPCVVSLRWLARGDLWMRRPGLPDFLVEVEGGVLLAVDAKCDPRDKGNVLIKQLQFDAYEGHAARLGAADALICASSPSVGTHHGFTGRITRTAAAFGSRGLVDNGQTWNITYGGEPSIEDLLKGYVK